MLGRGFFVSIAVRLEAQISISPAPLEKMSLSHHTCEVYLLRRDKKMSEMSKLVELARQKQESDVRSGETVDRVIQIWQEELLALASTIEQWVEPLRQEGMIEITRSDISVREEPNTEISRTYAARQLTLRIANKVIDVIPIARFCMGSHGRVDLEGFKDWERVYLTRTAETGDAKWQLVKKEYQAIKGPERENFNEDSFAKLLQSLF
jgi:hypothetical protein